MLKQEYPKPGEKWQHYKGGQYETICLCNHSETNEILVLYHDIGNSHRIFARPLTMFCDMVEPKSGMVDGTKVQRFQYRWSNKKET